MTSPLPPKLRGCQRSRACPSLLVSTLVRRAIVARGLAERGVQVPIVVWGTTVTTGRRAGPPPGRSSSFLRADGHRERRGYVRSRASEDSCRHSTVAPVRSLPRSPAPWLSDTGDAFCGDRRERDGIGALNENMNALGFAIIGLFMAAWVNSVLIYRYRGLDRMEVAGKSG